MMCVFTILNCLHFCEINSHILQFVLQCSLVLSLCTRRYSYLAGGWLLRRSVRPLMSDASPTTSAGVFLGFCRHSVYSSRTGQRVRSGRRRLIDSACPSQMIAVTRWLCWAFDRRRRRRRCFPDSSCCPGSTCCNDGQALTHKSLAVAKVGRSIAYIRKPDFGFPKRFLRATTVPYTIWRRCYIECCNKRQDKTRQFGAHKWCLQTANLNLKLRPNRCR